MAVRKAFWTAISNTVYFGETAVFTFLFLEWFGKLNWIEYWIWILLTFE